MKLTILALLQHMAVPSIVGHRCTVSILSDFHVIARCYQPFLAHRRPAAFPHTASIPVYTLDRSPVNPRSKKVACSPVRSLPNVSVRERDRFVARETEGQVGILSWGPGRVWRTDTLQWHSCSAIFIPEYTLY